MRNEYQRYAIYWTPRPGSDFATFGEHWFANPQAFGLPAELAARAIEAPARYGLHATLKAPFRLRAEVDEHQLSNALTAFCSVRRAPMGGPLMLAQFQRYLELDLSHSTADIDWLAAECVTHFDCYRAPLDESDRDKRAHASLTTSEEAWFQAFGYPFVLSEFRFHVSLAGPLEEDELTGIARALAPHLTAFTTNPVKIESLSLLGERPGGDFTVISRHAFSK